MGEVEEKDGEVAVGVDSAGDGGAAGALDAQAGGADGDAAVGADFGLGAEAPDGGPPGAVRGGAQDGTLFPERQIPGGLRGGAQCAVAFAGVVVEGEFFEQRVGRGERGDGLGGEAWREAFLPEVVGALDFAFGLGSGGLAQGDFVKAQGGAELGASVRGAGEEEGVVVDVESQREAMGAECGGQEVAMGEEVFALVKLRAGQQAAVESQ